MRTRFWRVIIPLGVAVAIAVFSLTALPLAGQQARPARDASLPSPHTKLRVWPTAIPT